MNFGSIQRYRRYLLLRRRSLFTLDDFDIMPNVFQAKQEAQPGTTLPTDFPLASQLAPLGYTTVDDIDGASVAELVQAGLTTQQANSVLAAVATLTPAVP